MRGGVVPVGRSEGVAAVAVVRTTATAAIGIINQSFVPLPNVAAHIKCVIGTDTVLMSTNLGSVVWAANSVIKRCVVTRIRVHKSIAGNRVAAGRVEEIVARYSSSFFASSAESVDDSWLG